MKLCWPMAAGCGTVMRKVGEIRECVDLLMEREQQTDSVTLTGRLED